MILNIICKASSNIGLGHLIRSHSFAEQSIASQGDKIKINYFLIGEDRYLKLLNDTNKSVLIVKHEEELCSILSKCDHAILDMTDIRKLTLEHIKNTSTKVTCLSPIFNLFDMIDYFFSRTKYLFFNQKKHPNLKVFSGPKYAIIQRNCRKISSGTFEENLKESDLPIAISMGGGDAQNKTLEVLKAVKKCKAKATFWVMIGEGYNHSLNTLIDEIRKDSNHEIILAKTNRGMWNILRNCVLCILPGGITTYEAAYAGLPTLNFVNKPPQEFLLKELVENEVAINFGEYSKTSLEQIVMYIDKTFHNKKELLKMHFNTKYLLDENATDRILDVLQNNK